MCNILLAIECQHVVPVISIEYTPHTHTHSADSLQLTSPTHMPHAEFVKQSRITANHSCMQRSSVSKVQGARMLQLVRMRHQSNAATHSQCHRCQLPVATSCCSRCGQLANAQFSNCSTKYLWQYSHFYSSLESGTGSVGPGGTQMNSQRQLRQQQLCELPQSSRVCSRHCRRQQQQRGGSLSLSLSLRLITVAFSDS